MTAPSPRGLRGLDISFVTWRGRAVRYVLIYLSLALALVGVRYATQSVRPALRAMQDQEAQLLRERDELQLSVQRLESPQLIREWAFAHGMRRFAEVKGKTVVAIPPLPPPQAQGSATDPGAAEREIEMRTEWKSRK